MSGSTYFSRLDEISWLTVWQPNLPVKKVEMWIRDDIQNILTAETTRQEPCIRKDTVLFHKHWSDGMRVCWLSTRHRTNFSAHWRSECSLTSQHQLYTNLHAKFNPVWLRKAESTSPKTGLVAELHRIVVTCNAVAKHNYTNILLHREEPLSSIH